MCGKAYDPRFIFAYPTASIAVMGGAQASSVLLNIKVGQLKKQGKTELTEDEKSAMLKEIKDHYEEHADPTVRAASQLWVDGFIDPADTRKVITACLDSVNNNPNIPKFNPCDSGLKLISDLRIFECGFILMKKFFVWNKKLFTKK